MSYTLFSANAHPMYSGNNLTSDPASQPALVKKRVVLHFPGFEPLDSSDHHRRYKRSAALSAKTWALDLEVGELHGRGSAPYFDVECQDAGHLTESRVYVFDHFALVDSLAAQPVWKRILLGYLSAARVVLEGGMIGYFRHAWRFGLFFLFPFLLVAAVAAASLLVVALPALLLIEAWNYVWSLALSLGFLKFVAPRLLAKFHTLHLFADWQLAVGIARQDNPEFDRWIETCLADIRAALKDDADEYVISSHSIGSAVAAHAIGTILAEDPDIFKGKRVVFATLGGAILQIALLRSASALRASIGRIARTPEILWLEVQCLTDCIHFYRSPVVKLAGHADAKQARIAFIRVKRLVSAKRYRKIKLNFLRIHRQYVLGSDCRSNFDFTLMTAGPCTAALAGMEPLMSTASTGS